MTTEVPEEAVSKGDSAAPARARVPGRKRARWRRGVKRAGLALALLVVLAGVVLFPYVTATPRPTVDYVAELDRIAREMQPEGENSWPLYQAIQSETFGRTDRLGLGNEFYKEFTQVRFTDSTSGRFDDPRHGERWDFVRAHPELLALIDRAAEAPGHLVDISKHATMVDASTGYASTDVRTLAYFNLGAMRMAANKGDWDGVERRLRTGLLLGRQQSLSPSLMTWLIAIAVSALAYDEVATLAVELVPPPEVCDRLIATLESVEPFAGPISPVFEAERLLHLDMLQRVWSDAGFGGGCAVLWVDPLDPDYPPTIGDRLQNVRAVTLPHRRAAERAVDDYFAAILDATRMSAAELEASRERFDDRSTPPWDLYFSTLFEGGLPCGGAHWRTIRSARSIESSLAGASLAILVARWRAEHGRWPASVDEVEPRDAVVDPVSGMPFECVLEPEGAMPVQVLRPTHLSARDSRLVVGPRPSLDREPDPQSLERMREFLAPMRPFFERILR